MDGQRITTISVLLAVMGSAAVAVAYPGAEERPDGAAPPPAAFEACQEKIEGTVVTITTPHGDTVTATCRQVDGRLLAVPESGAPAPESGAPPRDGKEQ